MTIDWARLVRAVVHGEYFLKAFVREHQGAGLFLASDDRGREVDVLVMPADAQEAASFRQHWSDAASLSHPGLMRTLAFGPVRIDGGDYVCAVSEKPEERLADVLAVRSLTTDETRDVLESILSGLACLHDRKLLHGSFGVEAIVAVDGRAKLTTRAIRRFTASNSDDRSAFVQEIKAIGDCIVRMLSEPGEFKPGQAVRPEFAMILRTISMADEKWAPNAIDLVHALRGADIERQHEPPLTDEPEADLTPAVAPAPRRKPYKAALVATLALVAFIAVAIYFGWPKGQPEHRAAEPTTIRRSEPAMQRPTRAETQVRGRKAGEWAVVAAIYNNRQAATRRADKLGQLWQGTKPQVLPPSDGARRYLVVLGSGLSKAEATRLRDRAASQGMPGDSYVTKLSW